MRTIVKIQCPKTLEIAKQFVKAEEAEFNSERVNSRYSIYKYDIITCFIWKEIF